MDSEVTKIVKDVRDEIVANYYKMKLNASGEFAEKTQVVEDGKSIKIVAPSYIYQMETDERQALCRPCLLSANGYATRTPMQARTFPKKPHGLLPMQLKGTVLESPTRTTRAV